MPSDDVAISVRNLTKRYRLFGHPGDRVKQFLSLGLKQYHHEFTALEDVSFDIKKGETVGIIGRNGSGKSTLLQLICGILKPTAGTVKVSGRIAALLELGAGFNPEFTGRENVYFQGALMGFDKAQMDARFEAIATFAEIGEFIDQPVRTYSSGMFVRLAFAASVHSDPDILVVDEALAVGDELFQRKCYARLRQLGDAGTTVLFVSHSGAIVVELCDRILLLNHGRIMLEGLPADALNVYQRLLYSPRNDCKSSGTATDPPPPSRIIYAPNGAHISAVRITDLEGNPLVARPVAVLVRNASYLFCFDASFEISAATVRGVAMIKTKEGIELGGIATHAKGNELPEVVAGETLACVLPFTCRLLAGTYFLNCSILSGNLPLHRIIDACAFQVAEETSLHIHGIVDFGTQLNPPHAQSRDHV